MRGISAVGSAQHWQCWGQGFESPMLHQKRKNPAKVDFKRLCGISLFHAALRAFSNSFGFPNVRSKTWKIFPISETDATKMQPCNHDATTKTRENAGFSPASRLSCNRKRSPADVAGLIYLSYFRKRCTIGKVMLAVFRSSVVRCS